MLTQDTVKQFRQKIWRFYRKNKRSFPFRETTDPYCVTVSEIMLQQTQAERVANYYTKWINQWPNWRALAGAGKQELLRAWSGLGYNRRALWLGEISRIVCERFDGALPDDPGALKALPGIGEYTSRAILIFSRNKQIAAIDTNIRQTLIAELPLNPEISQKELYAIAEKLIPRGRSRAWHYALMDYARLALAPQTKRAIPKPRQAEFHGSIRQIRGEIIRRLTNQKSVGLALIGKALGRSESDTVRAARSLERDGIIKLRGDRAYLAE